MIACPSCGCNDVAYEAAANLWGEPGRRGRCRFCGHSFHSHRDVPDAVLFSPLRCPHCDSDDVIVTSTRRKTGDPTVRYHSCRACGEPFKSVESG